MRKGRFLPAIDWGTEAGAKSEGSMWFRGREKRWTSQRPQQAFTGINQCPREQLLTVQGHQCPFPRMPGQGWGGHRNPG